MELFSYLFFAGLGFFVAFVSTRLARRHKSALRLAGWLLAVELVGAVLHHANKLRESYVLGGGLQLIAATHQFFNHDIGDLDQIFAQERGFRNFQNPDHVRIYR
jgi:hypothetical protein